MITPITKTCICGKTFEDKSSNRSRQFCSSHCSYLARKEKKQHRQLLAQEIREQFAEQIFDEWHNVKCKFCKRKFSVKIKLKPQPITIYSNGNTTN